MIFFCLLYAMWLVTLPITDCGFHRPPYLWRVVTVAICALSLLLSGVSLYASLCFRTAVTTGNFGLRWRILVILLNLWTLLVCVALFAFMISSSLQDSYWRYYIYLCNKLS